MRVGPAARGFGVWYVQRDSKLWPLSPEASGALLGVLGTYAALHNQSWPLYTLACDCSVYQGAREQPLRSWSNLNPGNLAENHPCRLAHQGATARIRVYWLHPPTNLSWSDTRSTYVHHSMRFSGSDTKGIPLHPPRSAWACASAEVPPPVSIPGQPQPQRATKAPKPPKPRKVEKRRKGRKG